MTPPGNRSIGDSLMFRSPQGDCPRWFVVGDFQNLVGVNGTAVELASAAARSARRSSHRQQAATRRLEVEGHGASQRRGARAGTERLGLCAVLDAECSRVDGGDAGCSIYFVIDTRSGRLRTVVSDTPLDGFVADGTPLCPKVVDMASPAPDLASKSDASTAADLRDGELADAAFDGPTRPLPGIHCDCQLGGHAASPSPAFLTVPLLLLLRRFRRLTPRT
jgi:hypothetical protein